MLWHASDALARTLGRMKGPEVSRLHVAVQG